MVKSGLITGAASLILILGSTLIHPFCAPCVGLFMGLVAGFLAGVFDKPVNPPDSIKKGAIAGVIAAAFGLVGGVIGGVINASFANPAAIETIGSALGIQNYNVSQGNIWTYQILFTVCAGVFNIVWMAILGLAGGAIWYQLLGKRQTMTVLPPQGPMPPV